MSSAATAATAHVAELTSRSSPAAIQALAIPAHNPLLGMSSLENQFYQQLVFPHTPTTRRKRPVFGPITEALDKYQSNQKSSRLLRLPVEVRARIWRFLIGDKLLHIKRVNCQKHSYLYYPPCPEKIWVTSICQALHTEDEIFKMSQQTTYDAQFHPHGICGRNILPVHFLRVCRQIHEEAHPMFWATNTLSFQRRDDLSAWMKNRSTAQKALIVSIHLDYSWRKQLYDQELGNRGIIKSLVNLRELHLYVEDDYNPNYRQAAVSNDNLQEWWYINEATLRADGTLNYKQLPLKNVTVVVTAVKHGKTDPVVLPKDDWQQRERITFAQSVRRRIMDSEGAQHLAEELAQAKAFQQAELEQRRASEPACPDASTREECLKMRQERREWRVAATGKEFKTKVRACDAEHVCLICLKDTKRTRAEARTCLRPGRCENK